MLDAEHGAEMRESADVQPTVIYIASASRSGSTVIDQVLGGMEGIIGVGELRRIRDFANRNAEVIRDPANRRGCTCGMEIQDCEFWTDVERSSGLSFRDAALVSSLGPLNRTLLKFVFLVIGAGLTRRLAMIYPPFKRELAVAENFMKVYTAVAKVSGARCVVDSSKTAHQFLMLKVAYPERMKLLALFRDGRAVSKSMIRGDRVRIFMRGKYADDRRRAHREAARHWCRSVMQIVPLYLRLPRADRYFLRHEDFCARPQFHMRELLERFGIAVAAVSAGVSARQSHNIGGSPSRFSLRDTGIDLDESWRQAWTAEDAGNFGMCATLINRLLGYGRT